MIKRMRVAIPLCLALSLPLLTGCSIKSPALMFTRQSTTSPKQLPVRAGVVVEGSAAHDPTDIFTYQFPFVFLHAQFPKPVEMEYFSDCVVDYFRDFATFQYTYPSPFDPRDVDLVVVVRPKIASAANNTGYSTAMTIAPQFLPGLGALVPFVLPQEQFSSDFTLEFALQTRDGREIATYESSASGSEWVWIYKQPFANYMWYDSVFRKSFFSVMEEVKQAIEKDSDKIMAALGTRG